MLNWNGLPNPVTYSLLCTYTLCHHTNGMGWLDCHSFENSFANRLRWKSFMVAKLNYNSLENICGWTVVLYDQSLLYRLKSFVVTDRSAKTVKLFYLERFAIYGMWTVWASHVLLFIHIVEYRSVRSFSGSSAGSAGTSMPTATPPGVHIAMAMCTCVCVSIKMFISLFIFMIDYNSLITTDKPPLSGPLISRHLRLPDR